MDDEEGCYWSAMFDSGWRVAFTAERLEEYRLPVRCPTMVCFGGANMKTLIYYNYQKICLLRKCGGLSALRRHLRTR